MFHYNAGYQNDFIPIKNKEQAVLKGKRILQLTDMVLKKQPKYHLN